MSFTSGKSKIQIDTASLTDGDSIAAYLVASGTQLTATGTALDVNVTASALPTGAATQATLASLLTEIQASNHVEDVAHVSGDIGIMALVVRKDTVGTLVSTDGDYSALQVDANGNLRTTTVLDTPGDYAEDAAHVSGDVGLFSLGVRNDNQATTLTSATGDYSGFATDDRGAMFTKNVANRSSLQQIITVGTSAVALPTTPLANRGSMFIQLLTAGQLYLGSATVTNTGAARGLLLSGTGAFVTVDAGPSNPIYGIANAAGKDVAVWEFA